MKHSEYTVLDLINAARIKNKELLNIIAEDVDVNSVAPSDSIFGARTALEIACKKCHPEIIRLLLKLGAKFGIGSNQEIIEIIQHILSRPDNIPARIETIRLMLENGVLASDFISAVNFLDSSIIQADDIISMIRQLSSFNIYRDAVTSEEYLRSARMAFLEEEIDDEYHLVAPEVDSFFAVAVTQLNSDTPIHREWLEERANSVHLSDEVIRDAISRNSADSLLSELANFLQATLYIYTDSAIPTIIRSGGMALSTIRIALIDNHYFSIENTEEDVSSIEILIEQVGLIAVDLYNIGNSFVSVAARQLDEDQALLRNNIINYFTRSPLEYDRLLSLIDYLDEAENNIGQALANAISSRIYVYAQDGSEILRVIDPLTLTDASGLIRFTVNDQGHYISLEEEVFIATSNNTADQVVTATGAMSMPIVFSSDV